MAKQPRPARRPEAVAQRLSKALENDPAGFTAALMTIVKEHGMTSVARQTGVSRHTLYRYQWGDDRPLLETTVKIAAACGYKLMVVPAEEVKTASKTQ